MRDCASCGVVACMTAHHIALVFHDFSTGGSERIAIRLANAWAAAGRRVTILCGTEAGNARALVSSLVTVKSCTPEIPRGLFSRLRLGRRIGAVVEQERPDILFAPGNFHLSVLAVAGRMAGLNRPPIVCKLSNPLLPGSPRSILTKLAGTVVRKLIAPVDHFTAMSPNLAREAQPLLQRPNLHCIDEPILEKNRTFAQPSRSNGAPIILCIGRLESQKDFGLAIRAFAELPPMMGARLVILGEGPDRKSLINLAHKYGVAERIELVGHVPDVRPWLAKARLLLLTSQFEGYPAVLIEARAAGVPVITTNCSVALSEILPLQAHGEIVDTRDALKIAGAIRRQIDQPRPCAKVIAKGTERYTLERIAPEYLRLFDAVTA
jgi:glycosyltransferase involved in cell wall biosynthesis